MQKRTSPVKCSHVRLELLRFSCVEMFFRDLYVIPLLLLSSLPLTFCVMIVLFQIQRVAAARTQQPPASAPEDRTTCWDEKKKCFPSQDEIRAFEETLPQKPSSKEDMCSICLEKLSPGGGSFKGFWGGSI